VLCACSHPGRIRSGAAFAILAGSAPIPANSGQVTTHYRLNRYGDRQPNRARHTIALSRIRWDEHTRAYVQRRTAESKTPREIKRSLIGGLSVSRPGSLGRGSRSCRGMASLPGRCDGQF
jgi:transposase